MKVFNLRCSRDHRFEGWFGSDDDYASQLERAVLQCPLCADTGIARLPSAPHVSIARSVAAVAPQSASAVEPSAHGAQAKWLQLMRRLIADTDDVGERFPEEARRIHYGEADERSIRGCATIAEAVALREEGIDVMPLPQALKEPLQ